MVIKIGKLIQINVSMLVYFLLIISTLCSAPITVELILTDVRANAIAKTELDQPVLLTIKINGLSTSAPFSVEGIESFHHEPRGSFKQFFSFNGKNTEIIEHHYLLQPKTLGHFKIGPAIVEYNNDRITSNTCELEVVAVDRRTAAYNSMSDPIFVEFFPQKTSGFVGEKIPLTLRFNSCKPVELIECLFPKVNKDIITFSPLQKISEQQKTRGSKKYNCVEWTCELEIKEAGHHKIPELTIVYSPLEKNSSHNNFFSQFFDRFNSPQKKVYGKEFLITINQLPAFDKNVQGIGVFESLNASLDKNTITQGNGCILSITLKGSSPLSDVKQPPLQLPSELKYYESASHMKNPQEKVFEYVIQGIQPGTLTIPSQEFIFFDTEKADYSLLKTEPLSLTVQPDNSFSSANSPTHAIKDKTSTQESASDNSCEIMPIYENSPWYPIKKRSLSPWLFISLCCIPLFYLLYLFITSKIIRYNNYNKEYLKHKKAFVHARRRLNEAKKTHNITQLHDIFIELFAQRCAIQPSLINQESIEACLRKSRCTTALLDQWNRFFSELSEITYAKQEKIDTHALFNRAFVWLDQLEEIL